MYCSRWAGMRLGYPPKTPQSRVRPHRPNGPTPTSSICVRSCRRWAMRSTGRASSPPASPITTFTSSACSRASCRRAWSTARTRSSIGIRLTRPCSPTSKSSTARAGARARWSRNARFRSGFSRSLTTRRNYSTDSTSCRAGRIRSRPCSATGSGVRKAWKSSSPSKVKRHRSPCSRHVPIR